jgi:RimJ/RimL family protein N-acetyltransferase
VVADPRMVGRNRQYKAILPARKVDLTGNVAMHTGKGNVAVSMGAAQELAIGAALSRGGKIIFALPSRNLDGQPNIGVSIAEYPNQLNLAETIDFIVTEYGVAALPGRTVRERALALIDVAHPDDRAALVEEAKQRKVLYPDQIYLTGSGHLYPDELAAVHTFKGDLQVRFRAIKPSDEDEMRRLFYRFSDEAVYYRYFSPVRAMPHSRMQEYVNVDYRRTLSIVGLVGEPGAGRIVAEARYVRLPDSALADIAMVVDEEVNGRGVATFMLNYLLRAAMERGVGGFTADVLPHNRSMWKVLEKTPYPLVAERADDYYHITILFTEKKESARSSRNGSTSKTTEG